MLTQLATLKARLGIADIDLAHDDFLTALIRGVSARFDLECRRTLGRVIHAAQEFDAGDCRVLARCAPVEEVARFEWKQRESSGWIEQAGVEFLVKCAAVICLELPLGQRGELARVTYTGGYVLPGTLPGPGQTPLPAELEQAALDQAAFCFQNRERLGLARVWDYHSTYRHFGTIDLLPGVEKVLAHYRRLSV